jgi:L-lactate dehydrogenase (cytochrome)
LSTLGTRSLEEVAQTATGNNWFQVYVWRDRGLLLENLQRAAEAKFGALVITVDTPVLGRRERDVRRGFSLPPTIGLRTALETLARPGWTLRFVRAEPIRFANVVGRSGADGRTPVNLAQYINSQFDAALSWKDLDWFRERWSGPLLLKGIQTVDDAVLAADAGVDAIVVSNHGGRQLDSAPAAIQLVAPVAQAVGDRLEIICDGGVRRGSDIVKALALGARACMLGRPYLYALGAGGEQGVDLLLAELASGVRRTMALLGADEIGALTSDLVRAEAATP